MTGSPIDADIRSGTFSRLYLLYGEEDFQKDYYCSQLRKALIPEGNEMNLNVWDGHELDMKELKEQAITMPFFAPHRLIIVKDSTLFRKGGPARDTGLLKQDSDDFAAFLRQIPEETVMVFLETEVDRGTKMYHAAQKIGARLVECKYATGEALERWIVTRLARSGRQIQRSAMELFLERTGEDMYMIANELDKLIAYTEGRNGILLEDVQALTTVNTEYQVFALVDAIGQRDQDLAMKMYRDLLQQKQTPVGILIMLYRQFERFLQMRDLRGQGLDTDAIAERMNIPSNRKFTISRSLRTSSGFTLEELRQIVELCGRTNHDIVTGRMSADLAGQLFITLCTSRTLDKA